MAQSKTEAARWLQKAADQGHGEEPFYLAMFCGSDPDVAPHLSPEATQWLEKAIAHGKAEAQSKPENVTKKLKMVNIQP